MNLINRILSFLGNIFRHPGAVTIESEGVPETANSTIAGYSAERTDTGVQVMCGIGASGTNHGVYSPQLGNWIIFANANNEVRIPATNAYVAGFSFGKNNVLWTGGSYMNTSQTATLSQNVTAQANGIVLCWSAYTNSAAQNYDWVYQFIPKRHVSDHNGNGVSTTMSTVGFGHIGSKYVYVYNNKIVGHDTNGKTGTANGVTYTNNYWVLRAVIGV